MKKILAAFVFVLLAPLTALAQPSEVELQLGSTSIHAGLSSGWAIGLRPEVAFGIGLSDRVLLTVGGSAGASAFNEAEHVVGALYATVGVKIYLADVEVDRVIPLLRFDAGVGLLLAPSATMTSESAAANVGAAYFFSRSIGFSAEGGLIATAADTGNGESESYALGISTRAGLVLRF